MLERRFGAARARDRLLELVEVSAMVPLVVDIESLRADVRRKRVLRIGERCQLEFHLVISFTSGSTTEPETRFAGMRSARLVPASAVRARRVSSGLAPTIEAIR